MPDVTPDAPLIRVVQPGDDITPDEFKQQPPRPSRLPRWLQRLLGAPVQPGLITDRSGESRPGITFKKPL